MEEFNIHNERYSITRAALILNCSVATIKRWYKWARISNEQANMQRLPEYDKDNRGTWYFTMEQIRQLQIFRDNLKRGEMAEFNSKYYWSKKKGE